MQNVTGLFTQLLDMLLSACRPFLLALSMDADGTSLLVSAAFFVQARARVATCAVPCVHTAAPGAAPAPFLRLAPSLACAQSQRICWSTNDPLAHTRSAKLAWAPHKSGMQHGDTQFGLH
jgi:hypothetical protein